MFAGILRLKHGSFFPHVFLSSILTIGSMYCHLGHALHDADEMTRVSSFSSLSSSDCIVLCSPIGTMYSSISNCPIQSTCGPKRKRQDDSAAYCDERSPGLSTPVLRLLHTLLGQGMYVTSPGNASATAFKEV